MIIIFDTYRDTGYYHAWSNDVSYDIGENSRDLPPYISVAVRLVTVMLSGRVHQTYYCCPSPSLLRVPSVTRRADPDAFLESLDM